MEYGLLLLRLVVGALFLAHGAQKLFGWFGGRGPEGTAAYFASLGFRIPAAAAILVGLSESGAGLLLVAGLLTPLAALLLSIVLLNAIVTVAWPKGLLGGWEFQLTLLSVAVALAITGPGRISLDRAIGWDDNIAGPAWGSVVLAGAIVATLVTTTIGRGSAELDELPG